MIQKKRLAAQDAAGTATLFPSNASAVDHATAEFPFQLHSAVPSEASRNSNALDSATTPTVGGSAASAHQLSMFNLVFAMQPSNGQREVDAMYTHVISKVTAALKYEQLKRGYIRREAELILSIKDDAQCKPSDHAYGEELMTRILAESTLAKCLSEIYSSITTTSSAHVVVNASVDLSLHIPDYRHGLQAGLTSGLGCHPAHSPHSRAAAPLSPTSDATLIALDAREYPILRPYHALLLLHDPEEVLKELPLDPLPLLVELIQVVTPTQCLEQLQTMLDCSLSQLYRLAAHLVHWQKAKIIDVISMRNVYVVSPDAPLDKLPCLIEDFQTRFPQLDLPSVLADLSIPRPYSVIVPQKELRTLYLEILTYLLRHNLVHQLHMYIYLMIPYSVSKNASARGNGNHPPEIMPIAGPTALVIPDPANATEQQRDWIDQVACEQPAAIASLFLRLVPYFSGKCHVEEIVFRENLTRLVQQLLKGSSYHP
ncbi:Nitrogen permease regulator 3 [Thoreauomyces humboldtii]|nr:Nitrogen permease regulator 3 [Thoreauomyces humboldtii]